MVIIILVIADIIVVAGFILFLYFKGKNRYIPKITDEEYKEFLEWYKKKEYERNNISRRLGKQAFPDNKGRVETVDSNL